MTTTRYSPPSPPIYTEPLHATVTVSSVLDKRNMSPAAYYKSFQAWDKANYDRNVSDIVCDALEVELERAGATVQKIGGTTATANDLTLKVEVLEYLAHASRPMGLFVSDILNMTVRIRFRWLDAAGKLLEENERSEDVSRELGVGKGPVLPYGAVEIRAYGEELVNSLLPRVIEKEIRLNKIFCQANLDAKQAELREQIAWQSTTSVNTGDAYENFMRQYPQSSRVNEAKKRLYERNAEVAWADARTADTIRSYTTFLQCYDKSQHANRARQALKALEADRDWQIAEKKNTVFAYSRFLEDHPSSSHTAKAKAQVAFLASIESYEEAAKTNTEDGWLTFIRTHHSSPKAYEASRHLKTYKFFIEGETISWAIFGGKVWEQPIEEALNKLSAKNATFVTIDMSTGNERTMSHPDTGRRCKSVLCNFEDKTQVYSEEWIKLNKIQFAGGLSASEEGLRVTKGLAIVPMVK